MPVHDWTRVEAGIFHDFHTVWIGNIRTVLNEGLLPEGYYALTEQHAGRAVTDVLTLHAGPASSDPMSVPLPPSADSGGTAVADAPPRTRRKYTVEPAAHTRRRSLAIRHVSGHRLVALIEIISPANKDRAKHVEEFVDKVESALYVGLHLLLVDLLPPGRYDSQGMHGAIVERLEQPDQPYDLPVNEPLTLASYASSAPVEVYLEHLAVGTAMPDMPLFLRPDRYINVPLASTYQSAFHGMPAFWRAILESSEGNKSDRE